MYGAIIGDLAGSIYEYSQIKKVTYIDVKNLIPDNSFFSDDTILTIAIMDAIQNDKDYLKYLKMYANKYMNYRPNFNPYFKNTFSPGFIKWVKGDYIGKSTGNGAMMRISPVGYLFDNEKDVIDNTYYATYPSHNSVEGVECATKIALIIYYLRNGYSKDEIINKLNLYIQYKPFKKFNTTCLETIDNCLYALFNSNNFEDSIKTVISYGGDTDTNACIVGSMAEAMYGIPKDLIIKANEKLPKEFIKVLNNKNVYIK